MRVCRHFDSCLHNNEPLACGQNSVSACSHQRRITAPSRGTCLINNRQTAGGAVPRGPSACWETDCTVYCCLYKTHTQSLCIKRPQQIRTTCLVSSNTTLLLRCLQSNKFTAAVRDTNWMSSPASRAATGQSIKEQFHTTQLGLDWCETGVRLVYSPERQQ